MFNRFDLVFKDRFVTYWLLPNNGGAEIVFVNSEGIKQTFRYEDYDEAAINFIDLVNDARVAGFKYVSNR